MSKFDLQIRESISMYRQIDSSPELRMLSFEFEDDEERDRSEKIDSNIVFIVFDKEVESFYDGRRYRGKIA